MGKPAARIGDMTAHGGTITGPGCPTVLIGGMPAVCLGDMHVCPMVTPAPVPVPHVGGPIAGPGCPTVLIGGRPAATMGDLCVCVGPPSSIILGCPTVLIGPAGGGGGGGGGAASSSSQTATGLQSGAIKPVKGSETLPIEIQAALVEAAKYLSPEETEAAVAAAKTQMEETIPFTIADFVEILKSVEGDEGAEAARWYASKLDFSALCGLAMDFVNGTDTNSKNDPNQMPTRFMILYGADDAKLKQIDSHPDKFGEDHKVNVANLRKGLRQLGYKLKENGPYDDEVYRAHLEYIGLASAGEDGVFDEEKEEGERKLSGLTITIKDVNPDDPEAQDDTFTLYSSEVTPKYKQVKTVKDDADPSNQSLDLIFTEVDMKLRYTLEAEDGATGIKTIHFKNRAFGKWKP